MEISIQGLESFLLTGWGVLYSVSLGWSFYNLLDQWPRLIRFGSIWRGSLGPMMICCWFCIIVLVGISLSALVNGALFFRQSGWQNCNYFFPLILGLIGLTIFVIPVFINRAVWGFALFWFP